MRVWILAFLLMYARTGRYSRVSREAKAVKSLYIACTLNEQACLLHEHKMLQGRIHPRRMVSTHVCLHTLCHRTESTRVCLCMSTDDEQGVASSRRCRQCSCSTEERPEVDIRAGRVCACVAYVRMCVTSARMHDSMQAGMSRAGTGGCRVDELRARMSACCVLQHPICFCQEFVRVKRSLMTEGACLVVDANGRMPINMRARA